MLGRLAGWMPGRLFGGLLGWFRSVCGLWGGIRFKHRIEKTMIKVGIVQLIAILIEKCLSLRLKFVFGSLSVVNVVGGI